VRISKLAVAAALAFGAATVPAQATVTFAQFFQSAPGAPFVHIGGGGGASFLANTGSVVSILDFGPLGFYLTDLSFSATSSAPITSMGGVFEQGGWSGTISFTQAGGTVNVLTATFTDAVFTVTTGPGGSQSGSLIVSGGCGSVLCYTSDWLSVDNLKVNNFGLSFSGITGYTAAGGNFTASGSGTFAGAPIPEPATWALMIAGFGLIGAAARRRRIAVAAN